MDIRIVEYTPALQPHFESLNRTWIERSFRIEPLDEWVLTQPGQAIVEKGGAILFAVAGEEVAGTVALRLTGPAVFEMTKMAVDERFRGQGIGRRLIRAVLQKALDLGARQLILYSNTRFNAPAIELYRKMGWVKVPLEPGVYERADIKMEYPLDPLRQPEPSVSNTERV